MSESSEKVLRKAAEAYLKAGGLCDLCYENGCTAFAGIECDCDCHASTLDLAAQLEEALSADPDLVVLLRFVSGLWADSWGESERQAALEEVIDHVNKSVRLTDEPPGYEWVEGEEDADPKTD